MDISNLTPDDGKNCAALLDICGFAIKLADALKIAGITLTGPGIERREDAKRWIHEVAVKMAAELRKAEAAKQGFKVNSVSMPQKLSKPKGKKKK